MVLPLEKTRSKKSMTERLLVPRIRPLYPDNTNMEDEITYRWKLANLLGYVRVSFEEVIRGRLKWRDESWRRHCVEMFISRQPEKRRHSVYPFTGIYSTNKSMATCSCGKMLFEKKYTTKHQLMSINKSSSFWSVSQVASIEKITRWVWFIAFSHMHYLTTCECFGGLALHIFIIPTHWVLC